MLLFSKSTARFWKHAQKSYGKLNLHDGSKYSKHRRSPYALTSFTNIYAQNETNYACSSHIYKGRVIEHII